MIPSLIVAPWLLSKTSSKRVQFIGFAGCAVANFILAVAYGPLKEISALFFTLQLGQNEFTKTTSPLTMLRHRNRRKHIRNLILVSASTHSRSRLTSGIPVVAVVFAAQQFLSRYIVQLSFQSLPGVTTMAISAEIYPSMVRGTGAGISAACGKVGATLGSYVFSELKLLGCHAKSRNRMEVGRSWTV